MPCACWPDRALQLWVSLSEPCMSKVMVRYFVCNSLDKVMTALWTSELAVVGIQTGPEAGPECPRAKLNSVVLKNYLTGECSLENLPTLCIICHWKVSAEQRRRRWSEQPNAKNGLQKTIMKLLEQPNRNKRIRTSSPELLLCVQALWSAQLTTSV